MIVGDIPREAPAFQRRQRLIAQLADSIHHDRIAVVCAVTGGRGIGKTQVAAAYARECVVQGWLVVAWIVADSPDQVLIGLDRLAGTAGVRPAEGDPVEAARAARHYLEQLDGRSLVVFDNATDPDLLTPWLPSTGRAQVVITSVYREVRGLGAPVDVGLFAEEEALGYLRERTGLADDEGALALSEEVGYLPLALAQASTVILQEGLSYQQYIDRLGRFPASAYLRRARGDAYPKGTAETILVSLSEARRQDPSGLAMTMLSLLSVLSPAGVARSLLYASAESPAVPDLPGAEAADTALGLLADASLITLSADGMRIIMHRLISRVLRDQANHDGLFGGIVHSAARLLGSKLIPEERAWDERNAAGQVVEQVTALWNAAAASPSFAQILADLDIARSLISLRNWELRHLFQVANLPREITMARDALATAQRVLGEADPETLTARNNLGNAYWSAGRISDAVSLFERNLTDRQQILGENHPDTLRSRNNLANAYRSAGRAADAVPLLERTLADRQQILGENHRDTLNSRNNLANAYWSAGRAADAVPLLERTLADRQQKLGENHPEAMMSLSNLAFGYLAAGRLADAIPLFERALARGRRVLGEDHPDTLTFRHNLAYGYLAASRMTEAILQFEGTLADQQRVLGEDHSSTLDSAQKLALSYLSAGRAAEAVPLLESTLTGQQRIRGEGHSDTLLTRRILAGAYQAAGRLTDAAALFRRDLADQQQVPREEDPVALLTGQILASACRAASPGKKT